jgi:hypothetical protein
MGDGLLSTLYCSGYTWGRTWDNFEEGCHGEERLETSNVVATRMGKYAFVV